MKKIIKKFPKNAYIYDGEITLIPVTIIGIKKGFYEYNSGWDNVGHWQGSLTKTVIPITQTNERLVGFIEDSLCQIEDVKDKIWKTGYSI